MRGRIVLRLGVIALWFGVWPLAHGEEKDKSIKNPFGKDKAAIRAGRAQFEDACAICHGAAGGGGRGPRLADSGRVRAMNDRALFDVIKNGVKGTEMPPSPGPDTRLWQLASFIRSLNANAVEQEVAGDAAAGEALFFGRARCVECHMIRGRGGPIGPDLSNVGSQRSLEKLQESLKDPSADIAPGFATVSVQTQ